MKITVQTLMRGNSLRIHFNPKSYVKKNKLPVQ